MKITIDFEVNETDLPSERAREYKQAILNVLEIASSSLLLQDKDEILVDKILNDAYRG